MRDRCRQCYPWLESSPLTERKVGGIHAPWVYMGAVAIYVIDGVNGPYVSFEGGIIPH